MSPCPSPDHLRRWLADDGRPNDGDVEGHLERCADCQQALERLTATAETVASDVLRRIAARNPATVGAPPPPPEAEGGGLRSAFERAIEFGIPVVTAVRPPYTEAWSHFHGRLAVDLAPNLNVVLAWCRDAVDALRRPARALAEAARNS